VIAPPLLRSQAYFPRPTLQTRKRFHKRSLPSLLLRCCFASFIPVFFFNRFSSRGPIPKHAGSCSPFFFSQISPGLFRPNTIFRPYWPIQEDVPCPSTSFFREFTQLPFFFFRRVPVLFGGGVFPEFDLLFHHWTPPPGPHFIFRQKTSRSVFFSRPGHFDSSLLSGQRSWGIFTFFCVRLQRQKTWTLRLPLSLQNAVFFFDSTFCSSSHVSAFSFAV